MNWKHASVGLLLALSACAAADKVTETEFLPLAGGFHFRAKASASYPNDSPSAEAQRIEWLNEYVADTKVCANGYTILSRYFVLQRHALLADVGDVYYEGRCS